MNTKELMDWAKARGYKVDEAKYEQLANGWTRTANAYFQAQAATETESVLTLEEIKTALSAPETVAHTTDADHISKCEQCSSMPPFNPERCVLVPPPSMLPETYQHEDDAPEALWSTVREARMRRALRQLQEMQYFAKNNQGMSYAARKNLEALDTAIELVEEDLAWLTEEDHDGNTQAELDRAQAPALTVTQSDGIERPVTGGYFLACYKCGTKDGSLEPSPELKRLLEIERANAERTWIGMDLAYVPSPSGYDQILTSLKAESEAIRNGDKR